MIDKDYLKSLNPCKDSYTNYLEYYNDWSGSLEEFLVLDKLTHYDKIWVFVRSVPKDIAVLFAVDCAERVLQIYEAKYPNDDRPRKAIEAARSGYAAAYAADAADAAHTAADAAAHAAHAARAAACVADGAAYAAAAAAYAADAAARAARAAACAADAAYTAVVDKQIEQAAQLELMKKYTIESLAKIGSEK